MLQGDRRQAGSPKGGVIARDQIARVLIDSLHIDAVNHKTFELVADDGPEQADLTAVFSSLAPDSRPALDAVEGIVDPPTESEPEMFRRDLAAILVGIPGSEE
jgi:hypothetical protein